MFELSKVETPAIRERVVSHLINISRELAGAVATGLGLTKLPAAAAAAVRPITDLPDSAALSILKNGPGSFRGRTLRHSRTLAASSSKVNGLARKCMPCVAAAGPAARR